MGQNGSETTFFRKKVKKLEKKVLTYLWGCGIITKLSRGAAKNERKTPRETATGTLKIEQHLAYKRNPCK